MFESHEELATHIRLGEDSLIELKRVTATAKGIREPHPDSLAQELAAFANSQRGGVLVLGVDDKSRQVVGLSDEEAEGVELTLRSLMNDVLKPALSATIAHVELPDDLGVTRRLVRVDIPRSLFVHHAPGGYFERIGSSKREMSPQALERLMQQRSQSRLILFDEQPVPGSDAGTLDSQLSGRFVSGSEEPAVDLMRKMGLLTTGPDGKIACTVAGALLACERPDQILHGGASIEAVHYAGNDLDADQQVNARRIVGPIDRQILDAFAFVRGATLHPASKEPARIERPAFSERAIFEAVTNAVAHRDYSMSGAKIRIFVMRDRLEIFSPGALPNTLTLESLPHRQYTRNETLVGLLGRLSFELDSSGSPLRRGKFMEARGEGVPIIFRESAKIGSRKPDYEIFDDQELKLTIYAAPSK